MDKTDYRHIKTLDDLTKVIHANHGRIVSKGEAVQENLYGLQEFYTPRNLAVHGVRHAALKVGFYTRALTVVRVLKRILQK